MKFIIIFATLIAFASAYIASPYNDFDVDQSSNDIAEMDNEDFSMDDFLFDEPADETLEIDLQLNVQHINKCKVCMRIAKWARTVLHLNKHALKKAAHLFCAGARLPFCKQIVDASIEAIVLAIKQGKNAAEACKMAHHC